MRGKKIFIEYLSGLRYFALCLILISFNLEFTLSQALSSSTFFFTDKETEATNGAKNIE